MASQKKVKEALVELRELFPSSHFTMVKESWGAFGKDKAQHYWATIASELADFGETLEDVMEKARKRAKETGRNVQEGDRVKLVKVNGAHSPLRYDVPVGTVGTVTFATNTGDWMFVDWGVADEAAMRMWPEELTHEGVDSV